MAIYEYIADDGQVIERVCSMARAPEIGHVIVQGGKRFRRMVSGGVGNATAYDSDKYPKVSTALPEWCDGADHVKEGRQAGKPIITSQQHEKELCRMHGFTRDFDPNDSCYG